ncbi:MAG: GerMN domain-containing protein [Acidobacteriota bacterium]
MNRTGWTILATGTVIVLAAAGLEIATRDARRMPSPAAKEAPGARPRPGAAGPGDPAPPASAPGEALAPPGADENAPTTLPTLAIELYFARPDGQGLSPERATIFATAALLDRLKQAVNALVAGPGPDSVLDPVLPTETPLRDLYLDSAGVLYVDFEQDLAVRMMPGSASERLAAGSLSSTLILNFPEVHQVKILVAGEEIRTLAGHLDLSRPLVAEPDLIRPWNETGEWWWPGPLAARVAREGPKDAMSSVLKEGEVP